MFIIRGSLTCLMYNLQILQGQFLGTQQLIRILNFSRNLEFFIFVETKSHSFESIKDAVSVSYLSVHGMLRLHFDLFLKL